MDSHCNEKIDEEMVETFEFWIPKFTLPVQLFVIVCFFFSFF